MPFIKTLVRHYQEPTLDDLHWEVQRLHYLLDKVARRGNISATTPTRKCLKCHGFGHSAPECTTEHLIIFTPAEKIIEVEENGEQTLSEDLIEEPRFHADEEKPFFTEHHQVQSGSPFIELSGGPRFDLEYQDSLVPTEFDDLQSQIDKLFVDSLQPEQPTFRSYTLNQQSIPRQGDEWAPELLQEEVATHTPPKEELVMTRATPLQTRDDETSWVLSEVEPCEMILPTEPQKARLQILYNSNRPTPQEYKHLPVTDVPKLDLFWTKLKSKKILVGSISKLRPSTSVLTPYTITAPGMKSKPPDPGRMTRGGSFVLDQLFPARGGGKTGNHPLIFFLFWMWGRAPPFCLAIG